MVRPIPISLAAIMVTLIAACGSNPHTSTNVSNSSSSSSAQPSPTPTPVYPMVPFAATVYDPTSPCTSLNTVNQIAIDLLAVPYPCEVAWLNEYPESQAIAGGGLIVAQPPTYPTQVAVSPSVTTAEAQTWASGFVRDQVISFFAEQLGIPSLNAAVTEKLANLVLNNAVAQKAKVTFASCSFPTSIRAVKLDSTAANYLQTHGSPQASSEGLVLGYPACPQGDSLSFPDGRQATVPLYDKPVQIVATGTIRNVAFFGAMWIINGETLCGPSVLRSVC